MSIKSALTAGRGTGAPISIGTITPTTVDIGGGQIDVDIRNAQTPSISIAGKVATVLSATPLNAETQRYTVQAPANFAGPATMEVRDIRGFTAKRLGAVQYVEPLVVSLVEPAYGNVNGGSKVRILGRGFRPGHSGLTVQFGDVPVDADNIKVLDTETVEVITPAGRLGKVDVTVRMNSGQNALLADGFEFLQPSQSTINTAGRLYDATLDPTGTYLFAAAGETGVAIYDINAARYTADPDNPLNPDDLLKTIDLDENGKDDRILTEVPLPGGYYALGVKGYFERFNDRVFVTAAKLNSDGTAEADSARLFIISFDSADITNYTIVNNIALPGDYAKGLVVENQRALVALGDQGLAVVDTYLHTKAYVNELVSLPGNVPALDVAVLDTEANGVSRYAVAAGRYNFGDNSLVDELDDATGGIYILERSTDEGLRVISHIPMVANAIVANGNYLYASGGEAGAGIIDISDPLAPVILHRIDDLGRIWDVDFNGNTLYLARGEGGIYSVDVTHPEQPVTLSGLDAAKDGKIELVIATNFSVIGGGYVRGSQGSVSSLVQVFPDVLLKLHSVAPLNGILDRNAEGLLQVRLRFNKAIDLWPNNLARVKINNEAGQAIPATVAITNNDAILLLDEDHGLSQGDKFQVIAEKGLASVKPLDEDNHIVLYRLNQTQEVTLTYRGARYDDVSLVDVKPRRVGAGQPFPITVSGLGIPADIARVNLYVGDQKLEIVEIETNDDNQRVAIIKANMAPISQSGQYDVKVEVLNDGIYQDAVLYGAMVIDAPLTLERVEPQWGPVTGGTSVTVYGTGFEPGNTVIDGIKLRIGSMPVSSVKVISTTKLVISTPSGTPGLHKVTAANRFGEQAELTATDGVGYGLKRLARTSAALVFPNDVHVDQESGVALTSGGYFRDGNSLQLYQGIPIPETTRAASFDIQDPFNPTLVGGSPSLPSGPEGQQRLAQEVQKLVLSAKLEQDGFLIPEEQALLDKLMADTEPMAFSLDSIRIQRVDEMESDGVVRKRLYVASGNGGVARLNMDEQNGLQHINSLWAAGGHTTNVFRSGHAVYGINAVGNDADLKDACAHKQIAGASASLVGGSFMALDDPIELGVNRNVKGAYALKVVDGWLYSGGQYSNHSWLPGESCILYDAQTADRGFNLGENGADDTDTLYAINLFDPALSRNFVFDNNVLDMVGYGDYLIVGPGFQRY